MRGLIYTYQHDGQTYTINLEVQPDGSYRAVVEGRSYAVQIRTLPLGGWHLTIDGLAHTAYAAAQGDRRFVHVDGSSYTLAIPGIRVMRHVSTGITDLTAQMPGQVTAVLVQAGEPVERGQTLLVMEAMKMEMRVTAPSAGTVKRLLVEPGTVVERGQLLAEMEVV